MPVRHFHCVKLLQVVPTTLCVLAFNVGMFKHHLAILGTGYV